MATQLARCNSHACTKTTRQCIRCCDCCCSVLAPYTTMIASAASETVSDLWTLLLLFLLFVSCCCFISSRRRDEGDYETVHKHIIAAMRRTTRPPPMKDTHERLRAAISHFTDVHVSARLPCSALTHHVHNTHPRPLDPHFFPIRTLTKQMPHKRNLHNCQPMRNHSIL